MFTRLLFFSISIGVAKIQIAFSLSVLFEYKVCVQPIILFIKIQTLRLQTFKCVSFCEILDYLWVSLMCCYKYVSSVLKY